MGSLKTAIASLVATLALSGCMSDPHKAYTVEQPRSAPARNLTSMDLALSCLDQKLRDYHAPRKNLTSTGIPNRAGDKVGMNSGVDMLKTSIGQLSSSNTYTYVDLAALAMANPGTNGGEIANRPMDPQSILNWFMFLGRTAGNSNIRFEFPDYNITGSISQADNNVTAENYSGGIDGGTGNAHGGIGGSANQGTTVVTVDMHVEDAPTLKMVNGLTTKNSITVLRNSVGADLSGQVSALGAHFNVSLDRNEGRHQAIRILVQLGTVELLGRLAHVPYEQCLTGESVQASALDKAYDAFEDMAEDARIRFAQQKLAALADPKSLSHALYYAGPLNGVADAATRDAIARYQHDAGLIASGQVDLDLYRSLRHAVEKPALPDAASAQATAPKLSIQAPLAFKPGTQLAVNLIADQDAHVQCFLQNDKKQILRIFPTAEQPDDRLSAGQAVTVPNHSASRQILLDAPGREDIGCVVSSQAFQADAALSKGLLGTTVLPLPSLQDVYEQYRREAGTVAVGFESLPVRIQ